MIDASAFLESAHRAPSPLLLELEQHGRKEDIPIVSRQVGRLLSTLVHCMQANRILELGTAYGYATLWMALALPPAGKIWTIEPDFDRTDVARSYFERAGKAGVIEIINQPATEILEIFPQRNLDIIFIDTRVDEYEQYLELCLPLLKLSGLLILDNLLYDGAQDFNRLFLSHPQLDATIIPLGDGTGIGARIK